jgi:hypothetical protein
MSRKYKNRDQKLKKKNETSNYLSKGGIVFIAAIILVFLRIPYGLWVDYNDSKNRELRRKICTGEVIGFKGLKGNTIVFEYNLNKVRFEKVRSGPSDHKLSIGSPIKIEYDSLDYENIMVL